MNRFVLKSTFIKTYIYHFPINIFYKNNKSKLCFGDRVAVQNDLNYQYGGSTYLDHSTHRIGVCIFKRESFL
jgi:hypothetical protein